MSSLSRPRPPGCAFTVSTPSSSTALQPRRHPYTARHPSSDNSTSSTRRSHCTGRCDPPHSTERQRPGAARPVGGRRRQQKTESAARCQQGSRPRPLQSLSDWELRTPGRGRTEQRHQREAHQPDQEHPATPGTAVTEAVHRHEHANPKAPPVHRRHRTCSARPGTDLLPT